MNARGLVVKLEGIRDALLAGIGQGQFAVRGMRLEDADANHTNTLDSIFTGLDGVDVALDTLIAELAVEV